MVHNKQIIKAKEPVKMRFRELADGSHSIYLDYYIDGRRSYEFLKLYLVPEVDATSRMINRHILQAANIIKAKRVIMLVNERAGISNSTIHSAMLLSDYIEQHLRESALTHRGTSYVANCRNMRNHLRGFLGRRFGILRMKEVDAKLCRNFAEYLKRVRTSTGKRLSAVSVHHYFEALKSVLTAAAKEEVIADNPIERMKKQEIPKRPVITREYLDADEVARLSVTTCRNAEVKRAFLFSCFTGLRISDIRGLRWKDFKRVGDAWYFSIVMQKTQEPIVNKMNEEAVKCLGSLSGRPDEQMVFSLPGASSLGRIISQWVRQAGIDKHVTFHTARHSYATMALMAGADIYTISKLLGHRSIATTTVYAAVVDAQRDAATDRVSNYFQSRLKSLKE